MTTPEHVPALTAARGGTPRPRWQRHPGAVMIAIGFAAAVAGYLTQHTTLLLAWKAGNLATVHAMCTSGPGQLAQGLNASAARNCQSAGGWYTLSAAAMWGGIALAIAGFVILTSAMSRTRG